MRKLYKYDNEDGTTELRYVPSGIESEVSQGVTCHPFNIDFNTLDFSDFKEFFIADLYERSARLNNVKLITHDVIKASMFIALLKWLKSKEMTLG